MDSAKKVINYWIRPGAPASGMSIYRLSPARKGNWWFRTTSDLDCLINYQQGSADTDSPATVNDLVATAGTHRGEVNLTWTAPGDDGSSGTASTYIIKYSTSAITTDAQFNAATDVRCRASVCGWTRS